MKRIFFFLKRDTTTFVSRVLDQVFPDTSGLVTLESKTYVSKDNSQKTMRGVRSHTTHSTGTTLLPKVSGLINNGNTCYMNSVMQCLNCVTPLVAYFLGDAYLVDANPSSFYDGTRDGVKYKYPITNINTNTLISFRPNTNTNILISKSSNTSTNTNTRLQIQIKYKYSSYCICKYRANFFAVIKNG